MTSRSIAWLAGLCAVNERPCTANVSGGRHCAIGGSPFDFVVTSTLASQAPPALGRALAIPWAAKLLRGTDIPPSFPPDAVSFVSVGDGSINNAHFLSAINMARYAQHRNFKVYIHSAVVIWSALLCCAVM